MSDIPSWTIREAGADDASALALIGAATFLETFAGILDGDAIVGHCAAQHVEAAYRAYLADGARAWIAEAQPGGAPTRANPTGAPPGHASASQARAPDARADR